MIVRKANLDEVNIIRKWIVSTAQWLQSISIPQWERFLVYNMTEVCLEDYKNDKLYVFQYDNGPIVGSLSYGEAEIIDKELWDDYKSAVFVHRVVVNEEFRGLKNGEYMISWAKDKAIKEGKELRLNCAEGNSNLYRYYKSLGFRYCGCKLGYHLFKT